MTKIQMYIYPGMTLLDLVGPLQVWAAWPDVEFQIVARSLEAVPTDCSLSVNPTHSFEQAWTHPDILFVPGGTAPTFELLGNEEVMDFLATQGENSCWITGVCTGSILLAGAGLLDGYKATSHWMSRDLLPAFGATLVKERWVVDRNRATGGGVTAGIDFGLAIMAHISGDEGLGKRVQLMLEYAPKPPYSSGTPEEASTETVDEVLAYFAADGGSAERSELVTMAIERHNARSR
jgi:cyclohexyl-isocyanide hydratase